MARSVGNALGGSGDPMRYDWVSRVLHTGVVDGPENNPLSLVFDNHYQVARYDTLTEQLTVLKCSYSFAQRRKYECVGRCASKVPITASGYRAVCLPLRSVPPLPRASAM